MSRFAFIFILAVFILSLLQALGVVEVPDIASRMGVVVKIALVAVAFVLGVIIGRLSGRRAQRGA